MSNALKSCEVCVNSTLAFCIYSHLLFVELSLIWCAGFVPADGMYFLVTSRFPPFSTLYHLSSEIHCQLESWSVKLKQNQKKHHSSDRQWRVLGSEDHRETVARVPRAALKWMEDSSTCSRGRCWSHCAATRSWLCSRERTTEMRIYSPAMFPPQSLTPCF